MTLDAATAGRVRMVVFDADGVLTDGGIYVADGVDGEPFQMRRFHVQDGLAVHLLGEAGVEPAIVSGRGSPALRERARELGVDEIHQVPPRGKVGVVEGMLDDRGLGWDQLACLADDLADLGLMERAGLPAAVANAVPEIRAAARWQSETPGGHGAVREFVESLLRARGQWDDLVRAYVASGRAPGVGDDGGGAGEP